MAIPLLYGLRRYGRIHEQDGRSVRTLFVHLFLFPLIPLRSLRYDADGDTVGERIALSRRSILKAYLTTWGLLGGSALPFFGPSAFIGSTLVRDKAGFFLSLALMDGFGILLGFAAMTVLFWMGRSTRRSTGKQAALWLVSSFALFLAQIALAALGIKNLVA
jgi:hypothetical protein